MSTTVHTEIYSVPNSLTARNAFVEQGRGAFHNMTGHFSFTATLLMDGDDYRLIVTKVFNGPVPAFAEASERRNATKYSQQIEQLKHALDARKI